jgi:AcrR family transcriptional regulator
MAARSTTTRSAVARTPLTPQRIHLAALELVDRDGLDKLSMRRLAAELGVEAMSLYHHVADKGAVLDGVVATVLDEMRLPEAGPWDERALVVLSELRRVVLAHPNVHLVVVERALVSPSVLAPATALLQALHEAPARGHASVGTEAHPSGAEVVQAFWMLMSLVSGSLGCELTEVPTDGALDTLEPGLFDVDLDQQFRAGVRTILSALARGELAR